MELQETERGMVNFAKYHLLGFKLSLKKKIISILIVTTLC